MKAEQFNLVNHTVKANVIERIMGIDADGKTKVTISNSGSKSDRQRGLQWRWYEDVVRAGIGGKHEDTKEGVHRLSKYKWAIPIFNRDDEIFPMIHEFFLTKTPDENMWNEYLDKHVHTEKFNTGQMAEYLTSFQNHYLSLGVNLTNPDLFGMNFK